MRLEEMAKEYRENMQQMENRVEELESMLPTASATRRHKLRIRIKRLRNMIYENMQTILYLESYYEDQEDSHRMYH